MAPMVGESSICWSPKQVFKWKRVTLEHARVAREAWRRFGKGHHTAALNLGDSFSYALAKTSGEPLLFKGTDFSQTDVLAVAY
jgi:ribonuclease VapC